MSVLIDLITVSLAIYTLLGYTDLIGKHGYKKRYVLPAVVSGLYLIAQTGWTAAFFTGNFWGAVFNNYIWFLFNTAVFSLLIMGMNDDGDDN